MKERLIEFLNNQGITATVFADRIGVQRSSISHILSGRNNPSYDFIAKILEKYPLLNANWLITGKGDMYMDKNIQSDKKLPPLTLFDPIEQVNSVQVENSIQHKQSDNSTISTPKENSIDEFTNVNSVERIIFFYENGSFKEYKPLP
ncbi:MAG: helix-turn-helix transcriptional regulator [Bacteroidales bacterium]